MIFARKGKELDILWYNLYKLYHKGMLTGISSMKTSTIKGNVSKDSDGVVFLYCGPALDEEKVVSYGKNIIL
jgi:hypothetical protein